MKKIVMKVSAMAVAVVLVSAGLIGCAAPAEATGNGNENASINVVSREEGSGTRGAFVELLEVYAEGTEDDGITTDAVTTSSTSVVLTTVAEDANAIGYISLGSLNDSVTALEVDGVAATTANVKDGSYAISRPFMLATNGAPNAQSQDFMNFIMSATGQQVIADNGYIAVNESAPAYTASNAEGTIVVAGSSSVTPVMEKLIEAYATANPNIKIELNTSDSSIGMSNTIDGVCDIGMASRELKESETGAGLVPVQIAIDGIAVIVSPDNEVSGLTSEQIRNIFLGTTTTWSDVS